MSDGRHDLGESRTASDVTHGRTLLLTLLVTHANLFTVVSRFPEFLSRRTTSTFGIGFTSAIGVWDTKPFFVA